MDFESIYRNEDGKETRQLKDPLVDSDMRDFDIK
jgi:hypothetical protein